MNQHRVFAVLVALLLIGFTASAETYHYSNLWSKPGVNVTASTKGGLEIVYSMDQMSIEKLLVDGVEMQGAALKGVYLPNVAGAPNLPCFGRTLALPQGAQAEVEVVAAETEVLRGIDIAPAPKIPRDDSKEPLVIVKDQAIYSVNANYPSSPVVLSRRLNLRGVDAMTLGITPFQYNPVTKDLTVYKNLRVRVRFTGGNGHFGADRLRSRWWDPILAGNLVNFDQLPKIDYSQRPTAKAVGYEYVIITPNDPNCLAWADTIKQFRTLQGIKTGVYSTDATGTAATAIEAWINNAYNTWDIPPVAILFLGDRPGQGFSVDSREITELSETFPSDNKYADVDGDSLPDINCARIEAATAGDLPLLINKFLNYERAPYTDPAFYNNPLVACGWQDERWFQLATEVVEGFFQNGLGKSPNHVYKVYAGSPTAGGPWSTQVDYANTAAAVAYWNSLGYIPTTNPHDATYWNSGTAQQINDYINAGTFVVQHRDHGDYQLWGEPSYSNANAAALTNTKLPFLFTINCLTGAYQYASGCLGEAFYRQAHGALGYVGPTEVSYSFVNDAFIWGIYDCMWPDFDPGYDNGSHQFGTFNMMPGFAHAYGKYSLQANTWPIGMDAEKVITYDLFHMHGDAFMTIYSEVPQDLTVSHPPVIVAGLPAFQVTANDGALIALTVNGEIIGTATATGSQVAVPVVPQVAGTVATLTITKSNYYRYTATIPVVSAARVAISPDSVSVNTPTPVTVTVTDTLDAAIADVVVSIGGYGVSPALVDTTDGSGVAHFNVNAPYGEYLRVTGREIGETYDMFTDTLYVTDALALGVPAITASVPAIGLSGAVMPGFAGQFASQTEDAGYTLYVNGCGIDASNATATAYDTVTATPGSAGTVTAVIGKSGYNLYTATFPSKVAYGTLGGVTRDNSSSDSLPGTRIICFPSGSTADTLFDITSDVHGAYMAPDSLPCGSYDLQASKFGFIGQTAPIVLAYGVNPRNFFLDPAPSGAVSGVVTEDSTGVALYAAVKVYRTDDNSLYATVYTDTLAGGSYSVPGLPYFNYSFVVTSYHHKKITRAVTVSGPARTEDFEMTPTSGDILVINDDDGKAEASREVIGKDAQGNPVTKTTVARAGSAGEAAGKAGNAGKAGESATLMSLLLGELGYSVTSEASGATNPAAWSGYDVVVWSDGTDQTPLASAANRAGLISYVAGGGKLLIEGGEVGYVMHDSTAFATTVLHVSTNWQSDDAGALGLRAAGHPLATTPNGLPASMSIAYSGYGDEDAVAPLANATVVYGPATYPNDAGLLAYDNDGDPTNGQIVFYAFNFNALADSATRGQLLENTMEYLLRPSAGPTATLSGVARLSGQSDHSGIVVTATLGGTTYSDTTDAAGGYSMPVYNGTYLVTGAKAGYVDTAASRLVTVAGSGVADFVLYPVVVAYQNDFEANNGGLTGTGCWEYGVPTSGPGSSHSGTKLWATTLAGNYPSSSNSTLTLPVLNSLGAGMTLEFWHWHAFEGTTTLYDGGNVKVSTDGGSTWGVVTPAGGYTGTAYASTPGVGGQQIFGGSSGGWLKKTFSLAPYAGQNTLVRLHFGSDGSVNYAGWYVDDIMIYGVDYTGVAANPTAPSGLPREYQLGAAYPNPGHGAMTICYQLPKSDRVELALYNVAGQLVRTLVSGERGAGYHSARWDGRDANGKQVSSGIYLYRLSTPSYAKTGKLSMVR